MTLHLLKGKIKKILRIHRLTNASEEDIVFNDNALSKDSSLPDDNDSCDQENEHTSEQLFTATCLGRKATTYNQADNLYLYTVWDVLFVYCIYAYFSMTWSLISSRSQYNNCLICNYTFFLFKELSFV